MSVVEVRRQDELHVFPDAAMTFAKKQEKLNLESLDCTV